MSSSAQLHLSRLGISVQEALDFLLQNLANPQLILDTCKQYGVSNQHLAEITGSTRDEVSTYWGQRGFDAAQLDAPAAAHPNEPANWIRESADFGNSKADALKLRLSPDADLFVIHGTVDAYDTDVFDVRSTPGNWWAMTVTEDSHGQSWSVFIERDAYWMYDDHLGYSTRGVHRLGDPRTSTEPLTFRSGEMYDVITVKTPWNGPEDYVLLIGSSQRVFDEYTQFL